MELVAIIIVSMIKGKKGEKIAREEIIRDFYGKIIGKYQYQSNGDIVVRDFYNRILGYYIASRDVTTDFYRRTIAKGNAVGMLLKG